MRISSIHFCFYSTIFCIYFLRKWLCNINPNNTKPPSPPRLQILGNIHQLSPLTFRSFRSLGARYGPIMLLHFGARPAVIVQSADAAGEIMRTHDLAFADKPNTRTTRRIFYDLKDVILAPYGEHWRKLKSICILQLLSSKRVGSFRSIGEEETSLLMDKIGDSRGSPLNLSELFAVLGNDVICRAAFGRKYSEGEEGKKFLVLLREVLQLFGAVSIGEFIPWLSWINRVNGYDRRVDRIAREIDDFLEMVVQEHLNGGLVEDVTNTENFVDILIGVFQENSGGVSIARDSIKAIILDMLAGATDTTSAALEWAMAELLKHPTALKNLQTEVREILKDRRAISDEDL